MLPDPLTVKGLSLVAHSTITPIGNESYAVTDVAPGKSVRQCASNSVLNGPATLTISHSVSNENKPAKTDRTLVRLDVLTKDVNGREMNAFAYVVIGMPRGALQYNDPQVGSDIAAVAVFQHLLGALCGITASALDESRITRILAGEP